jgi:transposase InsO family protein
MGASRRSGCPPRSATARAQTADPVPPPAETATAPQPTTRWGPRHQTRPAATPSASRGVDRRELDPVTRRLRAVLPQHRQLEIHHCATTEITSNGTTAAGVHLRLCRPSRRHDHAFQPRDPGQHTARAMVQACADAGLRRSMGATGICWDNSGAELLVVDVQTRILLPPRLRDEVGTRCSSRQMDVLLQQSEASFGDWHAQPIAYEQSLNAAAQAESPVRFSEGTSVDILSRSPSRATATSHTILEFEAA